MPSPETTAGSGHKTRADPQTCFQGLILNSSDRPLPVSNKHHMIISP